MAKTAIDKTIDKAVIIFYLLYLFVNIVSHTIVQIVGGVGNLFLTYLFAAYFIFIYGKRQARSIVVYPFLLFLFFYVIIIQFLWEGGSIYTSMGVQFKSVIWHLISFVPTVFSAIAIWEKSDAEDFLLMRKILIFIFLVIFINSFIVLVEDPLAAKATATGHGNYVPLLISYNTVYGLTICVSLMFVWIKQTKKKIFAILFLVLECICLFMASYMIALISAVIGVVCYFLLKVKNKSLRYSGILLIILIGFYFVLSKKYEDVLLWLASIIENDLIKARLEQIVLYFRSGNTDDTAIRFEHYSWSIEHIINHPLTGAILWDNEIKLSGHSANLDILGGCGIIVFALYFKFIWNIFKANLQYMEQDKKAAVWAMFIAFLFVSTFNPLFSAREIIFFYILSPKIFIKQEKIILLKGTSIHANR